MRLFIGVDFDAYKEFLTSLQAPFKDVGAFTFPKTFHLTLKFLGDVPEDKVSHIVDSLREVRFESFTARTSNLGVFPDEKYVRVLWLGLEPKETIIALQKRIDASLHPFFEKESRFHPHLTLARVKSIKDRKKLKELLQLKPEEKVQHVSYFSLIKSTLNRDGPSYEVLETFSG